MLYGFLAGAQTWRLTILSINGQQQPLDATLSKFEKTFYADGKYTDTDAIEGTWNMDSDSQLTEVYTNLSTGPLTQTYTILNLTAKTLITRYTSNGDQIVTQFDAVK